MTESSRTTYGIAVSHSKVSVATDSRSYSDSELILSATYPITAISNAPRSSVTLLAGVGDRDYESLDPMVSDTKIREDTRPQLGVSLTIPFSNGFGINAEFGSRTIVPIYPITDFRIPRLMSVLAGDIERRHNQLNLIFKK